MLLLVAALALGWNLGGHRLVDPDEGRNAEVAREMAATNDYLVPHLDGLPYLDKPIVFFAAAAAVMELLGPTELAARLPAYLATLGTLLLVVWFARRRWGAAAGWVAGLALATVPLTLVYARTAIFDSTLSLFTTAAILCFATDRPVLAWAAIGAGGLTKGPIAILIPLAAMIPHAWLVGGSVRRLFPWRGLLVFALVALPWFLAVTARLPEFPHYAFVRETFERVTTRRFHRTAPFWFYVPILAVGALPWLVPALAWLGRGRLRWAWQARRVNPSASDPLLLVCWVLGPLAFMSVNQSKLPQYVLPLMPAFALAAACALTREHFAQGWKVYAGVCVSLAVALFVTPAWLPRAIPLTGAEAAAIPPTTRGVAVALLASAALVAIAARRNDLVLAASGYAVVVIALPLVSADLVRAVGDDRSAAALATAVRDRGHVVLVRAYPTSLPFYLQEQVFLATAEARELTSTYIADYVEQYRGVPGSPLLPADSWRTLVGACSGRTIFVTRLIDTDVRAALSELPLLYQDARYVAYGPCTRPSASSTLPGILRNPHSAIRNRGGVRGMGRF